MPACSPRIDHRLLRALHRLDDPGAPIAETARRVGELADRLGATRPSYAQIRVHVLRDRELHAALRRRRERFWSDAITGQMHRDLDYYTRLDGEG